MLCKRPMETYRIQCFTCCMTNWAFWIRVWTRNKTLRTSPTSAGDKLRYCNLAGFKKLSSMFISMYEFQIRIRPSRFWRYNIHYSYCSDDTHWRVELEPCLWLVQDKWHLLKIWWRMMKATGEKNFQARQTDSLLYSKLTEDTDFSDQAKAPTHSFVNKQELFAPTLHPFSVQIYLRLIL